jgi:hypothetical protein
MSKLDIDVLVTLGMYGPAEAASAPRAWRREHRFMDKSWPDSSDELGDLLWRTNAEAVLDPDWDDEPPPAAYIFEPIPCPVTAVEGLKAISCYGYQTADDRHRWEASAASAYCEWLRIQLIGYVPGFEDAPWGWQDRDVDLRIDRARVTGIAKRIGEPAPAPPDVARVVEVLMANGIKLEPYAGIDDDFPAGVHVWIDRDFQAQQSRKIGHWASANRFNRDHIHVRGYADEDAAHVGYLLRRAVHEHVTERGLVDWTRRVARFGRVVVDLARSPTISGPSPIPPPGYMTLDQQLRALAALGEADEAWSTDALPMIADSTDGTVLCRGVVLSNGYASRAIQVANDDDGLRQMAMQIGDEDDRERVLNVNPETHTVLLIHGVADAERVPRARMQSLASPPGKDPKYLLDLTVEGLRWTPAVVVVIDKLPQHPTEAVLRHPGAGDARTPFGVYHP